MDRAQKAEQVEDLKKVFDAAGSVVVTQYTGLTVAEMTELRVKLTEAGANYRVVKNRLAKIALNEVSGEAGTDMFAGPVGIAYSEDPIAAPKTTSAFAKDNDKLVLIGGLMGDTVLDQDGVKALATLPSLDQLRGKLIGLLQAPAGKLAQVVQAPGGQLARVFAAYGASEDEAA